ncbi:MAG: protein translocase subunit SecF [Candidatus Promineifilaceae bacterium]|nr:protein translocase subunit SecF [Candidatus Promineifilaceae bacterium]
MGNFLFTLVEHRRRYYLFSTVLILLGIMAMVYALVTSGSIFRMGVDFRSGTRFEVQFLEQVSEGDLRDLFNDVGIANPSIIALRGEELENAWQIRSEFVSPEEAQAIVEAMESDLSPLVPGTTQITSVSPSVGAEVTRAALVAVAVAAVVILLYIMLVFRQVPNSFRYGASAVTAMVHDLFIISGFAAITGVLLGWEVDALFLTAVLTVVGFSLQDTIVVFDRIRENIARRPLERYEKLVNRSILETVHRSLVTQLSAMFIMVAILLFGGASIKPFIAVLFIGMLSGTYSSIFIASPLLVSWEKGEVPLVS